MGMEEPRVIKLGQTDRSPTLSRPKAHGGTYQVQDEVDICNKMPQQPHNIFFTEHAHCVTKWPPIVRGYLPTGTRLCSLGRRNVTS